MDYKGDQDDILLVHDKMAMIHGRMYIEGAVDVIGALVHAIHSF